MQSFDTMRTVDILCHQLRKEGYFGTQIGNFSRGKKVILANGMQVFIYNDKYHIFVKGKKTFSNRIVLDRIKDILGMPTTFHLE